MKLDMDMVQFESRVELEYIGHALNVYLKEHGTEEGSSTVKELYDILEVMHMSW
uniref:Uncharacterized protein n=1 Tax=uncultured prokaryote TaxID=198431 RepID=A0A0H5QP28_9ZZZZ|nr:hypothetical protein [uncultured prokaryote]